MWGAESISEGKKRGNQACLWGWGPHKGGEANASQPGQAPVCGQGTRFAIEPSVAWVTLSGKSKMRGLVGFVLALRGMRLAPSASLRAGWISQWEAVRKSQAWLSDVAASAVSGRVAAPPRLLPEPAAGMSSC